MMYNGAWKMAEVHVVHYIAFDIFCFRDTPGLFGRSEVKLSE